MNITEQEIKDIVRDVLANIAINKGLLISNTEDVSYTPTPNQFGIFEKMDDAINAARKAFEELSKLSIGKRKKMIQAIRQFALSETVRVSKLAVQETGMGRPED
ncbi:MAG TPA: aldehyde dehydrogenase EutE, partial [bacterium]|nr:aldehyde dehydrogenase EutE [bacterium]